MPESLNGIVMSKKEEYQLKVMNIQKRPSSTCKNDKTAERVQNLLKVDSKLTSREICDVVGISCVMLSHSN